jgi:Ca-activated chloride channel family protein
MKRHLAIAICLLLFHSVVQAQQFYLKGEVRDEAGTPLQNVMILHPSGYIFYSGSTGTFGILSSSPHDSLAFSLDGYQKQKTLLQAANYSTIVLRKAPKPARTFKLVSLTQNLRFESQQQWFTGEETYASTIENGMVPAERYPSTALTLNVDRASYSNIRRFLNSKSPVPPDAVRMEEMLNYFNFNYREPPPGKVFDIQTVLTTCPWNPNNQLLFAQINSRKLNLDSLPPTHLVFLIDVSGSMDMPNRLPLLKSGFKALVNNLRPVDSVSIIVYGGVVGMALPTTGGDEKDKIFKTIDSLQPGGSTPGESGIKLAYSVARNHQIKGGNNRIILATDGDFNVGVKTENELEEMIGAQRESGIYLTCLGIGMGNYKDSKIQALAQRGNGNFAYLDSYAEAEKVLLKEFLQTLYSVADDAYLNVKFNPAYVKEYRLLGFDNKVGAIKDAEAIVEGGEIGSAYSILVAFEIVPKAPAIPYKQLQGLIDFSLQYKIPQQSRLDHVVVSPEVSFIPFAEIPRCHQFATAVILFGSLLRKSKFVKDAPWNQILQIAANSVDQENFSQKEFISIVQQAKLIYTKKRKKIKED